MDPVDGDQVYAAERLLNQRTRRGKSEYLVKWKGWSAKYNTWEPVDNILDERLIQEFEDNKPDKSTPKRKNIASTAKEQAEDKPIPAKRGRRAARTASTSDNTSPSTSVGTRRSSRSVASVTAEQQKSGEQLQQAEESEVASEKPVQDSEDSDAPADEPEDVESEVENAKKKATGNAKQLLVTEAATKETTEIEHDGEEKEAEHIETANQEKTVRLESSTEDSSVSDEPVESAEEMVKAEQDQLLAADDSLEVFVKKSEPSMEENKETGENGSTESSEEKVYEITNEADAGHKIQMFTLPASSQPREQKVMEGKADGEDEVQERFEIVKEYGNGGSSAGNGSFLDTVGSEDLTTSNNAGQTSTPFFSD